MTNIRKYNLAQPAARARLVTAAKTSVLLAPFAVSGLAGAAGTSPLDTMGADTQAGIATITTVVGSICGAVLVIGLIIWGSHKFKPRGG